MSCLALIVTAQVGSLGDGKLVLSAGELVAQLIFKLQDARVKLQR